MEFKTYLCEYNIYFSIIKTYLANENAAGCMYMNIEYNC